MIHIPTDDLVPLDALGMIAPVRTDPVYANQHHPDNVFGAALYHPAACMIGHADLAAVIVLAARRCYDAAGWSLCLKDCLRPVEAQERMMDTDLVRANPHWLEEPRFLSPPGMGGHPRGMAVDIQPLNADGSDVDMGTRFDFFSASTDPAHNPAHRRYPHAPDIMAARQLLEGAMAGAAEDLGLPMLALPQEWWDFRFPGSYSGQFAPVYDRDLPPALKMMEAPADNEILKAKGLARVQARLKSGGFV